MPHKVRALGPQGPSSESIHCSCLRPHYCTAYGKDMDSNSHHVLIPVWKICSTDKKWVVAQYTGPAGHFLRISFKFSRQSACTLKREVWRKNGVYFLSLKTSCFLTVALFWCGKIIWATLLFQAKFAVLAIFSLLFSEPVPIFIFFVVVANSLLWLLATQHEQSLSPILIVLHSGLLSLRTASWPRPLADVFILLWVARQMLGFEHC